MAAERHSDNNFEIYVTNCGELAISEGETVGSSEKNAFDAILESLGLFGRWHFWIYFCMCLFAFMDGVMVSSYIFVAYRPNYRCFVENCDNEHSTYALNSDDDDPVFPDYVVATHDTGNLTEGCSSKPITSADQCNSSRASLSTQVAVPCERKIFDTSVVTSSIMTTYDVTCEKATLIYERAVIPFIGALYGLGQVIYAPVIGYIADRWGRSTGLFLSALLALFAGLSGIWVPYLTAFAIFRAIGGGGSVGNYMLCFVMTAENMHPSTVMFLSSSLNVIFAFGKCWLALASYLWRDWKTLSYVIYLPFILLVLITRMCPDSARWLYATRQEEKAQAACAQAARWNGKEEPTLSPVDSMPADIKMKPKSSVVDESNFLNLWRSPVLRKRTACMAWQWLSVTLSYYGLTYASTNLTGNAHLNVTFSFLAEVVGFGLTILLVNWVGRRWLLIICQVVIALSCIVGGVLVAICSVDDVEGKSDTMECSFFRASFSTALSMFGKVGASCAFAVVYLFTCEMYSTPLRGQVFGLFNLAARSGTIASFLIDILNSICKGLPNIVMGAVALVAAFLALNFPETVGLSLPETCEDAVKLKDRIPIYGRFPRRLRDLL